MRYKFSENNLPKVGDKRVVEMFLIFPKTINYEMRWLETAKILQKYNYYGEECVWKDIRFVDDL